MHCADALSRRSRRTGITLLHIVTLQVTHFVLVVHNVSIQIQRPKSHEWRTRAICLVQVFSRTAPKTQNHQPSDFVGELNLFRKGLIRATRPLLRRYKIFSDIGRAQELHDFIFTVHGS
jgi:hypothetical protein